MEIYTFALTPFVTNCYVIRDGEEALIIDPGEESPDLKACIHGWTVKTIVNTHCHIDHCGGNAGMLAHTGAELILHEDELPLLHNISSQGRMFGVEVPASPEPDRFLKEGDKVAVGSVSLDVLETPGHSPGHVVLVGDGFVIGGDVLFAGSIGRTDLPGGDHQQLLDSIQAKLWPLPDDTIVYSGHGPETTIGVEKQTNPFLVGL